VQVNYDEVLALNKISRGASSPVIGLADNTFLRASQNFRQIALSDQKKTKDDTGEGVAAVRGMGDGRLMRKKFREIHWSIGRRWAG